MLSLESKKKKYTIDGVEFELKVPSVKESEEFQKSCVDLKNEVVAEFFEKLGMKKEIYYSLQLWMIQEIINDLFDLKKN